MTAKKRWLLNCVDLTQKDETGDSHITWSSSGSEKEAPRSFEHGNKFEVSFRSNRLPSNRPQCNGSAIETFRTTITDSPDDVKPSRFANHSFDVSPVIGRLSLEAASPILNGASRGYPQKISPVIGSGNALRKLKRKQCKNVCRRACDTPDYVRTQVIIDSSSPASTQANDAIVAPSNSQEDGSEIIISSYSTSSVSESKSDPVLYYHIVPKKKRHKKGGLASQLQKALQRQRTIAGIWQHEVRKAKGESEALGDEFVLFSICETWREFGVRLLKCRRCDATEEPCILVLKGDVHGSDNRHLKLYPPFDRKTVNWEGETLACYYNVSKILFCNS